MAAAMADGGGGGGFAFDESSDYYQPGFVQGAPTAVSGGPDGESVLGALWSGGGEVRGQVEAAMKSAHPEQLAPKAKAWDNAFNEVNGNVNTLSGVISKLFSSWSGDDADAARKVFDGLAATLSDQMRTTGSMAEAVRDIAKDLQQCKDSWGHDSSTLGGFGNWVSGNEDRDAANDYQQLMSNVQTYLGRMPQQTPTQVKTGGVTSPWTERPAPTGAGTPSGAPSLGGGTGASHLGGPSTPHIGSPQLPSSTGPNVGAPDTALPPAAQITDPGGGQPGGPGTIPPGGTGSWGDAGLPGIDTGSSLAGIGDGSGFGGGAGFSGGAGLGGPGMGGAGSGLGAAGGSSAAGSGLGGASAAGLGEGGGAGLAGAGTGAGGRGAMMAPMSGNRGDEGERERTTWLTEDEDVWGATDAPPPVLGA